MTTKELREKRASLAKQATELLKEAKEKHEGRMDATAAQKFDEMHADIDSLGAQIDREERQAKLDREFADTVTPDTQDTPAELTGEQRAQAFSNWASFSHTRPLSDDQLALCERAGFNPHSTGVVMRLNKRRPETRALGTTAGSDGGHTLPEGFVPRLERALEIWGAVRATSTVMRTATGNDLPMPTADDTANTGRLLAEGAAVSNVQPSFGQLVLGAYTFTSDEILVNEQLLQDTGIDLEGYLAAIMGERISKVQNGYYTTGTGTNQPRGIVTASTMGKTTATNAAITYAELVDLEHSVSAVYRKGAQWMFNDSTLATFKKLLDGENRPLWTPGMTANAPDTILGYKYVISYDMASIGSAAKTVLFGDLSKYLVRECTDVKVKRLNERHAENLQVAFLAYMRSDGDLLDAGTHPVKHMLMAT